MLFVNRGKFSGNNESQMQKILVNINFDRISLNLNFNLMFIRIINNIVRENLLYLGNKAINVRFIKIIKIIKIIDYRCIKTKKTLVSRYSLFL